jgi:hypothetical protein
MTYVQARVLLVTAGVPQQRESLLRIVKLTQVLGAELHVLSVVPAARRIEAIVRSPHVVYDGLSLGHYVDACRRLQTWCQDLVSQIDGRSAWVIFSSKPRFTLNRYRQRCWSLFRIAKRVGPSP